jgi:hypothetical protein
MRTFPATIPSCGLLPVKRFIIQAFVKLKKYFPRIPIQSNLFTMPLLITSHSYTFSFNGKILIRVWIYFL